MARSGEAKGNLEAESKALDAAIKSVSDANKAAMYAGLRGASVAHGLLSNVYSGSNLVGLIGTRDMDTLEVGAKVDERSITTFGQLIEAAAVAAQDSPLRMVLKLTSDFNQMLISDKDFSNATFGKLGLNFKKIFQDEAVRCGLVDPSLKSSVAQLEANATTENVLNFTGKIFRDLQNFSLQNPKFDNTINKFFEKYNDFVKVDEPLFNSWLNFKFRDLAVRVPDDNKSTRAFLNEKGAALGFNVDSDMKSISTNLKAQLQTTFKEGKLDQATKESYAKLNDLLSSCSAILATSYKFKEGASKTSSAKLAGLMLLAQELHKISSKDALSDPTAVYNQLLRTVNVVSEKVEKSYKEETGIKSIFKFAKKSSFLVAIENNVTNDHKEQVGIAVNSSNLNSDFQKLYTAFEKSRATKGDENYKKLDLTSMKAAPSEQKIPKAIKITAQVAGNQEYDSGVSTPTSKSSRVADSEPLSPSSQASTVSYSEYSSRSSSPAPDDSASNSRASSPVPDDDEVPSPPPFFKALTGDDRRASLAEALAKAQAKESNVENRATVSETLDDEAPPPPPPPEEEVTSTMKNRH